MVKTKGKRKDHREKKGKVERIGKEGMKGEKVILIQDIRYLYIVLFRHKFKQF